MATVGFCSIAECGSQVKSRGWCSKHYQRWWHHGDPLHTTILYGDDEARFWQKVNKAGPIPAERPDLGPCWSWLKSTDGGGYGWFKVDGRMQKAHRWGFSHFVEQVPSHLEVDHLCFNRACVNFESHLEVVTPLVNVHRSHGGARKTHCKSGHPFDEANTYLRIGGGRKCRTCTSAAVRAYKLRKRQE